MSFNIAETQGFFWGGGKVRNTKFYKIFKKINAGPKSTSSQ